MPMRQLARILRYGLAGLVVLALVAVLLWPQARPVDTAVVVRGRVQDTLEAEGRTRVRDRYVITAPIAATALRPRLQPGDRVRAGQPLVVLAPARAPVLDARARAEARARVEAARDRLSALREQAFAAEAAARLAENEAARLRPLAARQLVAKDAAERADNARLARAREAASARFAERTAAHDLEAAQAALAFGTGETRPSETLSLDSPVDGVVLRRHYDSTVPVQAGTPLLEVGDPSRLEVEVDVLSADAVRLHPGMPVALLHSGGETPLAGAVRTIEPGAFTKVSALGVEEQRTWVIVGLTSPRGSWARLGDGYRVTARMVLRTADKVLVAPSSAVFRHDGRDFAFIVRGRRAALVPVQTGLRGEGLVEIRDGLAAGQRVIVHPDRELGAGDRVRPRD